MKDRGKELIEKIEKERGFVMPWRRMLAEYDPAYLEAYHTMSMHVFHERNALPLKFKEIIAICIDALTYYEAGLRAHVKNALAAGATEDEILEAVELCSLVGVHHLSIHMPALDEEFKAAKKAKKAAK